MATRSDSGPTRRSRLRDNRLWILAAVLGASTLYSGVVAVHDNSRGRLAVQWLAESMAEHLAEMAAARLDRIADATFAPVALHSTAVASAAPHEALDALVREQRAGERCKCRELLPATVFFSFDVVSARLDVATLIPDTGAAGVTNALLEELAARTAGRARDDQYPNNHLLGDDRLGSHMLVTNVQRDETGTPVAVFGLVGDARALTAVVFGHEAHTGIAGSAGVGIARLDSQSVHVTGPQATALFGHVSENRPFVGTARANGALEGMAVTIGLKSSEIPSRLTVLMPHNMQLHLGLLIFSTIVVVIIAIGSSQREIQLARARSDFVAGVSHELRMPLAQILLASETLTLGRERNDTERKTLSTSIVREARRLVALVDNVLFFSRSGAVGVRPHPQPVELGILFSDAIEAVELAVSDAQQTIEAAAPTALVISADRQLIRQAIVNLVDNALKYGKPGQRIRLSGERQPSGRVRIYVDDQGPGIPKAERARVFEPYERRFKDQVSERTGTGLGLAVVSDVVRASGGTVWIEDAPGGGTRVGLELPAADPA